MISMEIKQSEVSKILQNRLRLIQEKNPSFSLRAFAQKLEMNSGALSLIIAGKRKISEDLALRIIEKLELDKDERELILHPFKVEKEIKRKKVYQYYNHEIFQVEENWIALAILNLVKTKNFIFSNQFIAQRLDLENETVATIVRKLFDNQLLEWDENGKISRTAKRFTTSDNKSSESIKNLHLKNLQLAEEKLICVPIEFRDFTSMTLALDSSKLDDAKALIRKFQDDLSTLLENSDCDSVYKINVQLFPLTMPPEDENDNDT